MKVSHYFHTKSNDRLSELFSRSFGPDANDYRYPVLTARLIIAPAIFANISCRAIKLSSRDERPTTTISKIG